MTVEDVLDRHDDGELTLGAALDLLVGLGYAADRAMAALELQTRLKAEDEAIAEKMISLLDRKATSREWMVELGHGYGRAVYLLGKLRTV